MIPLGVLANSVVNETPWIDEDFNGLTGNITKLRLHDRTATPVSMSVNGGSINVNNGHMAFSTGDITGTFVPLLPLNEVGRKVRVRVDVIHPNAANHSRPMIMIGSSLSGFTLGFKVYPQWNSGLHVLGSGSDKWSASIPDLTGPATVEAEYHCRGVADHTLTASVNGDKVLSVNPESITLGSRIGFGLGGSLSNGIPIFDNLKVWIS